MVFASPVFVFLFLPVALLLYFISPRAARNAVLLAVSLLFYAWGEAAGVLLIIGSIAVNYALGLWVERHGRPALVAGIVVNVATLAFWKYANFGVANLNSVFAALQLPAVSHRPVHLPIGVSFFTFEAIAYLVDVRRGETRAQRNPIDFALFMTFFPHLIAGPVVRYKDLAAALASRTITAEQFASGVRRFIIGLAKKALLANTLAATADRLFGLPPDQLGTGAAWLGVATYTLFIYFDFSGYSDMAIGLARLFGFELCENFRSPYTADSVTDFWRRWHISLSTWFRDYLYIPLGGNRRGSIRTYLHLLTVFALCGLWHGASWAFLVWGLFHGAFLVLERAGLGRTLEQLPSPLRHGYALLVVAAGWVFFRADSFAHAIGYLGALAGLTNGPHCISDYWTRELALALVVGVVCCLPVRSWLGEFQDVAAGFRPRVGRARAKARGYEQPQPIEPTWSFGPLIRLASLAALFGLLLASAVQLASGTYNPFIYYRF